MPRQRRAAASGDKSAGQTAEPFIESSKLTRQELRVTEAVARGLTNQEVAQELMLSAKTVEFHLSNVYAKLSLRSRTELVLYLARHGLKQKT